MRRYIPLICLALLLSACQQAATLSDSIALAAPQPTATSKAVDTVNSVESLLTTLHTASMQPALQDNVRLDMLSVTGKIVAIGSQRLQAFEYDSAESAQSDAAQFSRDGAWITRDGITEMVNWIATPHLYRNDKLLVVYVGDDTTILRLLSNTLGYPFAGGANPYSVAMQISP